MDVTAVPITLHPKAATFLFEHYVTVNRVFADVLGQLDIAYLSIAVVNHHHQLFFFSSKPSIQQNLIEKNLCLSYGAYQPIFIHQKQPKLWSELDHGPHAECIEQFKKAHELHTGMAIPIELEGYKIIFSFGFKMTNFFALNKTPLYCKQLLTLGKYCFKELKERIPFPDEQKYTANKPHLRLIINN